MLSTMYYDVQSLLRTTERVVQQVDSVEYGLTDIQEYYANTGGLVRAAKNYIEDGSSRSKSGAVGVSIVEAFEEVRMHIHKPTNIIRYILI